MSVAFRLFVHAALLAIAMAAVAPPDASAQSAPAAPVAFGVLNYELAADQNRPELCFVFSGTLARQPDVPLESYVIVDPAVKFSVTPRNNRLCLAGLGFGASYEVLLKAGLPGIAGPLVKEARFTVAVPNRAPAVAFAAMGDVLPRIGSEGLPLRTVNVPKVQVDIFRISDHDLLRERSREPLSPAAVATFVPTHGERVWQGTVDVKAEPNRDAVTPLAVEPTIGALKPGIYVAVARQPNVDIDPGQPLPTQYFTVSDLGLTAYRGPDNLLVTVRSLSTAAAAAGVDVALIGENNHELGRSRTDGSGFVRFDPALMRGQAGDRPAAVYAYGVAGEFSVLNLDSDALDLTGEQAGGRTIGGPAEAMILLGRALYRPGETAQAAILVRDEQGRSVPKLPLTIKVVRPDGAPYDSRALSDQGVGSYNFALDLPPTGPAGVWTIAAYVDPAGPPIGSAKLEVRDPAPANLAVSLSVESAIVDPAQADGIDIQGQYFFGLPAGAVSGDFGVTLGPSPNPFPAYPGYFFGLSEEAAQSATLAPTRFVTDASGRANLPLKLTNLPKTTKPLEARLTAGLLDLGGRRVERTIAVPVANQPFLIGVKPGNPSGFSDGQVRFDVIVLAPDGARQERTGLGWEIVREDDNYAWQGRGSSWTYRTVLADTHMTGGTVDVPADGAASVMSTLPPGRYRIEIFDPKGETASSARFTVGWWASASEKPVPDLVEIKPAKPLYAAGENAEIFVKPPFDAEVTVVTSDRATQTAFVQHVPAAGATVRVDIPRDIVGGLYVLATAYAAPGGTAPAGLPRRAVGLAWLPLDPTPNLLDVKLNLPETIAPRQTLRLPIAVSGAEEEPVFVAVTADDEDVAASNGSASPDPVDFFLGKRVLGATVYDLYGSVIDAANPPLPGHPSDARSNSLAAVPDAAPLRRAGRIASLYSGIVALDKAGNAVVLFAIPDFNGRLRIRAVAWTGSRLGQALGSITVRDSLQVQLPLPRFLAPDDRADLSLSLDNSAGPRGEYHVIVKAEGAVALQGAVDFTANLAEREQRTQPVGIQAQGPGDGAITLYVSGPGDVVFERRFVLPVRPANPAMTRRAASTLKPGGQLVIDPNLTTGLRPDTVSLSLAIAGRSEFDLSGVAAELAQRNDRAAEQTVSAATPRIAPAAATQALGVDVDPAAGDQSRGRAVLRLMGMQRDDGSFAPWDRAAGDPWLTAYVLDFLGRAKGAGLAVADGVFQQGLNYLAKQTEQDVDISNPSSNSQLTLEDAAYANAILARYGRLDLPHLRYFDDRIVDQIRSPLAVGWVGAAYAALGDKDGAAAIFGQAASMSKAAASADGFGSDLRDQAALAAVIAESGGPQPLALAALGKAAELAAPRRQFSAQEGAWIFRAASALGAGEAPIKLQVGDKPVSQTGLFALARNPGEAAPMPPIKNIGDTPLYASLTVTGAPASSPAEPKEGGGYEIQRFLFDRMGKPVDLNSVRQNDVVVVVLTGRFAGQGEPSPLVTERLPAGWEIEAANAGGTGDRFPWLKDVTGASHVERRDDRYLVVPNLAGERHEFKLAYVVRAATRGQFILPGAFIEDTVRPYLFARTSGGHLKIDAPPS